MGSPHVPVPESVKEMCLQMNLMKACQESSGLHILSGAMFGL